MNDNDFFSFDDFQAERKRRIAKYITRYGIAAIFVVNAVLTGVYGAFSVLSTLPINEQPTFALRAVVGGSALLVALVLILLLDGSRFIWNQAAIAPATSGHQQALARAAEVAMIATSTIASVAALRVLLDWFGMATLSAGEIDNAGTILVWVISGSLLLDFIVGWLYVYISPESKAIRSESARESLALDTLAQQSDYQLEATRKAIPAALAADHPGMVAEAVGRIRKDVLGALRIGDNAPRQLPSMAASQPNEARGLRDAGEGGSGANP